MDAVFPSMRGPSDRMRGPLRPGPAELLWLTGLRVEVLDAERDSPAPSHFECHTNLNFPRAHPRGLHRRSGRGFTLTQGQVDIRLPPGFGVPAISTERMLFASQLLNLLESPVGSRVRHRVTLRYVRDADLDEPFRPLVPAHAFVMASLEGRPMVFNVEHPDPHLEDASCHAGLIPEGIEPSIEDAHGRSFAGHWVVGPGEHEYRTLVTDQLGLTRDVRVHFIGVHVHVYSTSLELRDLTTGESVWTSLQKTREDGRGLAWIDYYSSPEGLTLHADHQYALVSRYRNDTGDPQDAMATMFLYYEDAEFENPLKRRRAAR